MTSEILIYPDRQALIDAALALDCGTNSDGSPASANLVRSPYLVVRRRNHCMRLWLLLIYRGSRSTSFGVTSAMSPSDHPDSNYGMAKQVWLDLVPIPAANIHPIPTDLAEPQLAATDYDRQIATHFAPAAGAIPVFDIILLGMGDDGHTASLFPHTAALAVVDRLVTVGDKDGQPRITFTFPLINQARSVIFLISGTSKQAALAEIFAPVGDLATLIHLEVSDPRENYYGCWMRRLGHSSVVVNSGSEIIRNTKYPTPYLTLIELGRVSYSKFKCLTIGCLHSQGVAIAQFVARA